MTKESDFIEAEGEVMQVMGHGKYLVHIEEMGYDVNAQISGKMRKHNIKIIEGDKVKVEISPYEPTMGRITYRFK